MTRSLRQKHLYAWISIALILPIMIILGWLAIPNQHTVKLLKLENVSPLPIIKGEVIKQGYVVQLRTDKKETSWQLHWRNQATLQVPSAVIYEADNSKQIITNNTIVGRIEARGDYFFELIPKQGERMDRKFLLYDFIKGQLLDSIQF